MTNHGMHGIHGNGENPFAATQQPFRAGVCRLFATASPFSFSLQHSAFSICRLSGTVSLSCLFMFLFFRVVCVFRGSSLPRKRTTNHGMHGIHGNGKTPSRLRSSLFAPAQPALCYRFANPSPIASLLLPHRCPYCFSIPPPDFLPRVQKDPHLPRAGYQPGDGVA